MAQSPSDLMSSGNTGISLSTDYGTGNANNSLAQSNVSPVSSPEVMPAYKGNLGRKAAMFGNFRNPVQGQGTFFPQDDTPFEGPRSDPGSNFALEKQVGGD